MKKFALAVTVATLLGSNASGMCLSSSTSPYAQDGDRTAKSQIFIGTIVKRHKALVFRELSGDKYSIDDNVDASVLIGKRVRIIGVLDPRKRLIHVESIEQIS